MTRRTITSSTFYYATYTTTGQNCTVCTAGVPNYELILEELVFKYYTRPCSMESVDFSTRSANQTMIEQMTMVLFAVIHSSEIGGLCLMKCPSEILQNLPYFYHKKAHVVFFYFSISCSFIFSLANID